MKTNADNDRLVKVIFGFKDEIKDEFQYQLRIQTKEQRTSSRYRGALLGLAVIV